MSGLSAACFLSNDFKVHLYEASGHAGGRCRSFFDSKLETEIDNGNHIVLSANSHFLEMCRLINSYGTLNFFGAVYNFFDFESKEKWNINIGENKFPFWIFNKEKRIPKTKLLDYLSILNLLFCNENDTVEKILKKNSLYNYFWEPLTLGILNTQCEHASAMLLKNVIKETFLKGGKYSGIYQPKKSWNNTLIEPMLKFLKKQKIFPKYHSLLKEININKNKITDLNFKNKAIKIGKNDYVIFAVPPNNLNKFFPSMNLPDQFNTIINVHFKIDRKQFKNKPKVLGILNSISHWVFLKKDHCSVTLSASNKLIEIPKSDLIQKIWCEISQSLNFCNMDIPPYRLIIEKKATYNQSPENNLLIRKLEPSPDNAFFVGDWTEFNFPCSIESSIISARRIKEKLIKKISHGFN